MAGDTLVGVRTARRWSGVGAATLVLLVALPAAADSDNDQLIRKGVELRRAGKDEQALEIFQQAYRMQPTPRAQAQSGLAEQALGRWLEAERDLTEPLRHPEDPWVAKNAATLRQSQSVVSQHLGNLQILGSPPGATVKFDNRIVGTLPMETPVRVTAGDVLVSVSAPGHVQIQRKLAVDAGAMVRETFTLPAFQNEGLAGEGQREGLAGNGGEAASTSTRSHVGSGGHVEETLAASGAGARPDAATRGLSKTQGWAIAVASAGVLSAGVGAAFAMQAISKNNESKPGCDGNVCVGAAKQARLDALTAGNRATIAAVIGGALVATGTVLFFVGRRESPTERTALRLAPAITPDSLALVGALSF
jgi:hypothetical protein